MRHLSHVIDLSDTSPYVDVSLEAQRAGLEYPVYVDSRIKKLLELEFHSEGLRWDGPQPLSMYIVVPLAFLVSRFTSMRCFRFSVKPPSKDGLLGGIPVIATTAKDTNQDDHITVDLDLSVNQS